jgi:hypothetical protein
VVRLHGAGSSRQQLTTTTTNQNWVQGFSISQGITDAHAQFAAFEYFLLLKKLDQTFHSPFPALFI